MKVTNVYTKKEYKCKKCDGVIFYGKITDDDGNLYTIDGMAPNNKYGPDSNVVSGAVDSSNQSTLHACTKHYVEEAVAKAPAPNTDRQNQSSLSEKVSGFKPEFVNETEHILWNDLVAKCAEYAILAQKKLDEYPEIVNPALKGLITNQAFTVLKTIKENQRNG